LTIIFSSKEVVEVDRHPEKRMKAAYAAFEEERLPELKAEHPNMRLSQVKQLLWKEWLKSPRNPVNQKQPA
jgi:Coiled-coil domain-containing protein 124 /Oxs1